MGEHRKINYISYEQATRIVRRTVLSFVSLLVFFHYKGLNFDGVMYAFFQIVLWTSSGIMQRSQNFNFVLDTLLPQMRSKTSIINGYLDKNNYIKEMTVGGVENAW